ncbi:helix-turn-helix domain-containing protein [Sulfitobacter sp. JBTF-M27]|uniref:Helix-turn-helix domain-containing protein n=1 Tax=Sulfitobacter sediminilitoris TaxID=2698830 RepID=A0A6P0CDF3_9RHOB|nr:helix-turn-helix transcriptional regulator [Sulfitobacter sediminilitoris]NEK22414.1 helix-turn-helix domain-containing protein [Sulfitobacter sediminilitoris]
MLHLPLPMLSALLCLVIAALLWRLDLGRGAARVCFVGLFLTFALAAVLVGLRFGYGIDRFTVVQRMLPLFTGPLMYLGFLSLAVSAQILRQQAAVHLGVAIIANIVFLLLPSDMPGFDWAITTSYLFYLAALIRLWRKGPDHLIHARLDIAPHITRWMLSAAGLLAVILLMDTAIALSFAMDAELRASALITFGSVLLIGFLLVMLASLPTLLAATGSAKPQTARPASSDADAVDANARALLERTKLYLDPDLSVQRLARRLHVPERTLSAAINQSQGTNISQYVNRFRLEHAAELLRETDAPVTKIMTQSGFLTRSNFYREFQRVYGQSPASYRDRH